MAARTEEYKGQTLSCQGMRAYAIGALVIECANVFTKNIEMIIEGEFHRSLIDSSELLGEYRAVTTIVKEVAYNNKRVLSVEAAGYRVIGGLLDIFVPALIAPDRKSHRKILQLFPRSYLYGAESETCLDRILNNMTPYQKILAATDYVSGMTDRFAVDLFQSLSGIKLPE